MRIGVSILGLALLGGVASGQTRPVSAVPASATSPVDKAALREKLVADAVEDAVDSLMSDVGRQPIFGRVTVRDLLVRTDSFDTFLATLRDADQIGGPRWLDENTVQVRLAVTGPILATSLITIANDAKDRSPVKPDELSPLLAAWAGKTFSAVGVSTAPTKPKQSIGVVAQGPGATTQPVFLPFNPPKWANQSLQADGKAGSANTRLRAARAAEVDALANLRKQVDELEVAGTTVGEIAKNDRRLNMVIDRAIQRARLTKVDYLANGGANVRANLDLNDLWREIDAARQADPAVFSPR